MNAKVLLAVFKRNFVSYFLNPTGYVFICVFVLLSSIAAFLPDEFFNANLANLDQLNYWFPFIMLVFAPAIAMSIWAEEGRQGTDELLLTIPASDPDIVTGKYLAAVAIYTSSLAFSFVCNLIVLSQLGSPDVGLFIGTYFGYWLVGVLMIAIGMVASFLTSNLTVAYVLGAIFNAPLVLLIWAGSWNIQTTVAGVMKQLSIGGQLEIFGRGVMSLSAIVYFVAAAVTMIYLSVILIGARHWAANRKAEGAAHFAVRIVTLLLSVAFVVILTNRVDLKADVTSEGLNSLAPETRKLLSEIDPEYPVQITAFISPEVPEEFVQTKIDMENLLREIASYGGGKIRLKIIPTELFTKEADMAREDFGIEARPVPFIRAGVISRKEVYLGVAFQSGLQKPVVLDFINRGVPVEYELVRSICTVTDQGRKKIGVVKTGAELFGSFNPQFMQSTPERRIIAELKKMYDVEQVDPSSPIADEYDALLAVQPSSLAPPEMENFLAAVRSGIPTAVFEDPCPATWNVPATSEPPRPANPMMGMMQPPGEKGDITPLWRMLDVDFPATQIVWQDYNPLPKLSQVLEAKELVFVDSSKPLVPEMKPFNVNDPISAQLQHVLFLFPGSFTAKNPDAEGFVPLVRTTKEAGTVDFEHVFLPNRMPNPNRIAEYDNTGDEISYIMGASIRVPKPGDAATDDEKGSDNAKSRDQIHVILTPDIDMMSDQFFLLREQGNRPGEIQFDFDNVTYVLNVLDELAGDTRFLELRGRRPKHRTLEAVDVHTAAYRKEANEQRNEELEKFEKVIEEAKEEAKKSEDDLLKALQNDPNMTPAELGNRLQMMVKPLQKRLESQLAQLERERDEQLNDIERRLRDEIQGVQNWYKFWAVALPPIPPLLLGLAVFIYRRMRESEGVSSDRLR